MDVYAQAVPPAKRKAQGKVVAMPGHREEVGLKVVCPRCVPTEKRGFQQVFCFVGVPDGI